MIGPDDRFCSARAKNRVVKLLAVNDAGELVGTVHVGLVTSDDPFRPGDFKAAILNARVAADQLKIGRQLKIALGFAAFPNDERVPVDLVVRRRFTRDGAVLDAPKVEVSRPAFE